METILIRAGVDTEQFKPAGTEQKLFLRKKYGFDAADKIALHVGHVRRSRNIELLKSLVNHDFRVLVAGSTSTPVDKMLKSDLENSGIRVMDEYITCIEELYQLSDVYVFPVTDDHAAIEFPLSVLEAMSCNLPVVTTPYGSLKDNFDESEGFAYFSNEKELIVKTIKRTNVDCKNRDLITGIFSWESVFNQLFEKLEQL